MFRFDNDNAHGGTLARRLDHEGQRERRALARLNHFPLRCRHSEFTEFSFRPNFIESKLAFFHTVASVGNPARLENSLQLAVLAKGSVNRDEGKIDVVRQIEMLVTNIDLDDFAA